MEFITSENVVFSYELGYRGFHWHCENDDIQLQLVSQCNSQVIYHNTYHLPAHM